MMSKSISSTKFNQIIYKNERDDNRKFLTAENLYINFYLELMDQEFQGKIHSFEEVKAYHPGL